MPSFIANGPSTLDVTLSAPPIPRTIAGKRLTDSERDALTAYALYAYDGGRPEGDRIRTIAENIGWSYTATHKILSEAGAPMRSRGGNTRSGTKQLT
nr:helix-turn-helix domain-containing protein [Streptomyces sp. NBC_00857]